MSSNMTARPAPAPQTSEPGSPPDRLVFVGTYTEPILFGTGQILQGKGQGIYVYRLDRASGALQPQGLVKGVPNPSYLAFHPSRRFLYAVNELKAYAGAASGSVSAFALDPGSGDLRFLNRQPSLGTDPCHLAVDRTGRHVLVANYSSGSVCVLPVRPDGSLGEPSDFVQHHGSGADPARQAGPHAHCVLPDPSGCYVFACDLGLDRVLVYEFDSDRGALRPHTPPWVELPAGAGPRQIVMHPRGEYAYVLSELSSTITAWRYDAATGTLAEIQALSTLPDGFTGSNIAADIQISPAGDYLYGSNRGHDSIVAYAVDQETGRLSCAGHDSTHGQTPRCFAVDPDFTYTLVANQDSDSVVVFRNDPATGRLIPTGQAAAVPAPVCVKVL